MKQINNIINRERPLLDMAFLPDHNTVCEVIRILDSRYSFLSVTGIGESVLSKKIHMMTIGNPKAEKSILYVGAHHGAEWMTTLILLRFVNELCEYYKASKQPFGINLVSMLNTRCLRIVPCLNPDGVDLRLYGVERDCILYERLLKMSGGDFSNWKANARGVDLNHNYDAGFLRYKELERENDIQPGPTRYSGDYPLSEPETHALASYIRYDSSLQMILTLHTEGEEIYCSDGGRDNKRVVRIGKKLAALSGYRLTEPEGLASYGGLTDWYIKEFSRPAFTIECGKSGTTQNEKNYFNVYASIREMLLWAPLLI